jgi:trehalose utilization protein
MDKRVETDKFRILALDLEQHIDRYVPESWTCDIREVCPRHHVLPSDAKNLLSFFKGGELEKKLAAYRNGEYNERHFQPWYVRAAILDYFSKKKA